MTVVYAHRGASAYYPENTLLAFEKAIELDCDAIETDVQLTKDGELVLIHDEYVNRTTNGTGLVKDYSLKELRGLDAGSFKDKSFSQCKIPTLKELLDLVKPTKVNLNLEIKSGIVIYPQIEEKLMELIHKEGMDKRVMLSSFNHYSLAHCKELCPSITTAVLYMEGIYEPQNYCKTLKADGLHPFFYAVRKEVVEKAHREGIFVNPFTVDEEPHIMHCISMGVDGIITNYPDRVKAILKK